MYRPIASWHKRERRVLKNGYVAIKVPEHPNSWRGWYYEHRLVEESRLRRILEPWETVHHISQIKTDNRPCNLFTCTEREHRKAHR